MTPDGWREAKLGDVIALEYGKALAERARSPGPIPVFGSNGIVGSHCVSLVRGPGIIVGRKGTVGAVCWSKSDFWTIDTTYFVRPRNNTDLRFIYHLLGSMGLARLNSATGVPGLNRNDALASPIKLPPLPEQRKIAAILSSVDETIENTEAVINQLQVVKKSMMEELLTRGMPGRHKQFKKTEVGDIPKTWNVVSLEDLCSHVVDCPHATPVYTDSGPKVIRTADVVPGQILLAQARHVSDETYRGRIARLEPQPGDILYSREGERFGIAAPIPPSERLCLGQRMMQFRASRETDAEFLCWLLNSQIVYRQAVEGVGGSTSPHVNVGSIRRFVVPRPPLDEQRLVGHALSTVAANEAAYHQLGAELRALKSSLLEDLLSGEVRVKVTGTEAAA